MSGSSTLCSALARGSRLNVWKTNPISLFRMRANSSSDKSLTFWPLSQYSPPVGVSRQPIRFMSVDFHDAQGVHDLATHVVIPGQLVGQDQDFRQRRVAGAKRHRLGAGHRECPTSASSWARAMR